MFGYATNETAEFMPLLIALAHRLSRRLSEVRKEKIVDHFRPDGKTQVTFAYDDNNVPSHLDTIVISTQHDQDVTQKWLEEQLRKHVVEWVIQDAGLESTTAKTPPCSLTLPALYPRRPNGRCGSYRPQDHR